MKKVIFYVLIAVFISFNANAGNELHIVQSGDTLWALSKTHYKDPYLWGKIWMNNTYLNDPNLIFPGEVIEYTKYGIAIYKKAVNNKKVVSKKAGYTKYDIAVFYDGKKYYSDCGGGFCIWNKKDFSIGKLSYDDYNNIEVSAGNIVYIYTHKAVPINRLYVYRKIKDYYSFSKVMDIFVPIGEIKIIKKIKPFVYKCIIKDSRVEVAASDVISPVYPYKSVKKIDKPELLGNIPIKLIELSDIGLTSHVGYYMFFRAPKYFNKDIIGHMVFIDRVNENLPENTNIAKGIVISQYKRYISIFFDTYNSDLKEMFDKTQNYVLR